MIASKDEAITGLRAKVSELRGDLRRERRRVRWLGAHNARLRAAAPPVPREVDPALRLALAPSPGAWAEVSRRQDRRAEEERRMRAELDTANRRIVALTAEVDGQAARIAELERRLGIQQPEPGAVPDVWRELEEP